MTDRKSIRAKARTAEAQPSELREEQLEEARGGAGAGNRFNGTYFVHGVTHSYSHSSSD